MNNSDLALIVSISGTIIGPLATALINNRHESKLRKLDIQQSQADECNQKRNEVVSEFLASVGSVLSPYGDSFEKNGRCYFLVYQYVPVDAYSDLDALYAALIDGDLKTARTLFLDISKLLSNLIRQEPPISPSL